MATNQPASKWGFLQTTKPKNTPLSLMVWRNQTADQPTNQPRNHPSNDVPHKKSKIQVKYWWKFLRKSQLEKLVSCFWLLLGAVDVDVVGWLFVCFFFQNICNTETHWNCSGLFYICAYVWMSVCITIYLVCTRCHRHNILSTITNAEPQLQLQRQLQRRKTLEILRKRSSTLIQNHWHSHAKTWLKIYTL